MDLYQNIKSSFYNFLNLEDKKLFSLIIKGNLFKDIDLHFNKKVIIIKKFILYHILFFM